MVASPKPPPSRHQSSVSFPPTITLAFWRVRETWRLLLVAALGVLVAVMLICTVPLFSTVSLTAGLRSVLHASPQDSEIALTVNAQSLDTNTFAFQINQPLQTFIQQHIGAYINSAPEIILQTQGLDIISSDPGKSGDQMTLLGFDMQTTATHAPILQGDGRLPQANSTELEAAINQKTADALHVGVGAIIPLRFTYYIVQNGAEEFFTQTLPLHIVGIFLSNNDTYWQGYGFDPSPLGSFINYTAVISTNTYLAILSRLRSDHGGEGIYFTLNTEPFLNWYYYLNVNHISINNLDNLIAQLSALQTEIYNAFGQNPYFASPQLIGPALESNGVPSTIERYRDRASVATIPADILALQILALVLFFVSMVADLIIDRQAGVIALLRSRGASQRQIFGSFITQSIALGLIALICGPLLAIPMAHLLGQSLLATPDQNALNVLEGNPLQIAWTLRWFALAAAVCAVAAMILAVRGSASQDVLTLRREAARSTRQPLWRRLNLDIIFIIIALTGFVVSLYVTSSSALNAQTNLLIATPLALAAPILLVVAGVLLFLRCFPLLLRLGSQLAAKRPAAPPLVAIAQMARAPRQATRMILLLALASSFAIFTLIFNASQSQQLFNITAYQVGADFSGTVPQSTLAQPSLAQQTAAYRHIPGVISASLGYSTQAIPEGTGQSLTLEVRAVDTGTYAQTAIWTNQDSSQPLAALMQALSKSHTASGIPAIVDALTWQKLDLSPGATFELALPNSPTFTTFVAVAEVQHIPTVNDSLASGATSDYSPPGGILVDYQPFASAYTKATNTPIQRNIVWLRTTDDPAALTQVRAALTQGPLALSSLFDRRALLAQAQSDPLYINLVGILALGAATAMLLALVGNLLASWLSAKSRLTSFAVLRALGSSPRQIASVLLYEQSIIYCAAIGLGVLFGGLLAATVVPVLVFSSTPQARNMSSGEFYVIQRVLPMQVILPSSLLIAFILLILLCVVALSMIARIVSKPSISQTLRLNED